MKVFKLYSFILFLFVSHLVSGANHKVSSPNGKIEVSISVGKTIEYAINYLNDELIIPSSISLILQNGMVLGKNAIVDKIKRNVQKQFLYPTVPIKNKKVLDEYNEIIIDFKQEFSLVFRVYNDGVAYRFITQIKDDIIIENEEATFNFKNNNELLFPENFDFRTDQENPYKKERLSNITFNRFASLPLLIDFDKGLKMTMLEVDLEDYPGMYLRGGGANNSLYGKFPPVPAKVAQRMEKEGWDRHVVVTETENYIAKTSGSRTFPWRAMVITENDKDIVESEMVYKLSQKSKIKDESWIKPGKSAWDWWNDNNVTGVDFKAGINTQTYKYYIDFAAKQGLDYIILDEGWYVQGDLMKIVPEMDVKELIDYAEKKNVGVILWVVWKTLYDQLEESLALFQKWGVKGIKVDFMNRDDQLMINVYHKIAERAAAHKLMVEFHGSSKPDGIRYKYPNVITRDLKPGLEYNKWDGKLANPEMAVTLAFTRMVSGPMDYTPGAMINAQEKDYKARYSTPMSLGTRCHQMAMFVVYESPLTVMADNPTNYYKEQECTTFIAEVPTVWDETRALKAKVGDYIVIARRKGNSWYLGAMTDWTARDIQINLDFLEKGTYTLELFKDGINADRNAMDYKKEKKSVKSNQDITIKMAPGGGWAAKIY